MPSEPAPFEFRIGDRVVVNESGAAYMFTKPGSTGVVIDKECLPRHVFVEFDTFTGERPRFTASFPVNASHLTLISRRQFQVGDYVLPTEVCVALTEYGAIVEPDFFPDDNK